MDRNQFKPLHVPKVIGADCELGNFYLGTEVESGTGALASRALLREIDGLPMRSEPSQTFPLNQSVRGFEPMDWGRKFLVNGSCVYVDMDHLEICIPEVLSAHNYVAAHHAMLRIAERARQRANGSLRAGVSIQVIANTSDGRGNSFGSHMNFAITRQAWQNLFHRKIHHLLWLASYQVSSILFTGAGKAGSENGAPRAIFQLSQRADFFEQITSLDTTATRGIVNQRDEPLAGGSAKTARLHCIFYDTNLCHTALFLKAGVMQVILSMLEQECVDPDLILEDPLEALETISRDLDFRATVTTSSGKHVTAIELQQMFLERAARFAAAGYCDDIVPEAKWILDMWSDTLDRLSKKDWPALAARLDWARKLSLLLAMKQQQAGLNFDSPEIRYADHQYANLDREKGLYWACERRGAVDMLAADEAIERLTEEPPENTRAWTRAALLRKAVPSTVHQVDWDSISFHIRETHGRNFRAYTRRFSMEEPWQHTRKQSARHFRMNATLEEILDGLEERKPPMNPRFGFYHGQKGDDREYEIPRP